MSDKAGHGRTAVRPSYSCTECSRRKVKCNKQIPCEPCVKRGAAHACRLEDGAALRHVNAAVSATASPASRLAAAEDTTNDQFRLTVFAEIDVLRRRVFELEQLNARISALESTAQEALHHVQGSAKEEEDTQRNPTSPRSRENTSTRPDDGPDTALTLEFFALGADRRPAGAPPSRQGTPTLNILDSPSSPLSQDAVAALLPHSKVEPILDFAREMCSWQHSCLQEVQFRRECEAFFDLLDMRGGNDRYQYVQPAWLAVYLAVQAIAVSQMSNTDAAHAGLSDDEKNTYPDLLFNGCMSCLETARYMEEPSLAVLQAISIIVSCGRSIANANLMSSLLAVGIKSAYSLNLHRLGNAEAGPRPPLSASKQDKAAYSARITSLELGKRVFWTLAIQDWYSFPFKGACLISPKQLNTPLPLNCADEDLEEGALYETTDSRPSPSFKLRFSARIARILRDFFDDLNVDDSDRLYVALSDADTRIRAALSGLPPFLRSGAPASSDRHLPTFVPSLRLYLHISTNHKLIVLHRAYLATGKASSARREASHQASLTAARLLLAELGRYRHTQSRIILWQIPYHAVSAASLLALHLFGSGRAHNQSAEGRAEVSAALDSLRELSSDSIIARRGVEVLSDLLQEETKWAQDEQYRKKREAEGGVGAVVKRIKFPTGHSPGELPLTTSPSTEASGEVRVEASTGGFVDAFNATFNPTYPFQSGSISNPFYFNFNEPAPTALPPSMAFSSNGAGSLAYDRTALESLLGEDMNLNLLGSFGNT